MKPWMLRGCRLAIVAAVALLWEAAGRWWVDPDFLPPLSKVVAVLWGLLQDPQFQDDMAVTGRECLVAFALVAPLGIGAGFLLGESRRLERLLGPSLQLLMTLPKSVFIPVFVLMFGIGFSEKVIFAMALAFFIVVPAGTAAVQSVPPALVVAARSFGASRRQIYTRIYLPAVTPIILGGVRLALIFTVHGVVFAEMYGATAGIGRSILLWGEQFEMDLLLAAVLLLVGFTVALNELMQFCETYSRSRLKLAAGA